MEVEWGVGVQFYFSYTALSPLYKKGCRANYCLITIHRVLLLAFFSTVYRPSLNIDINRNCCCFEKPKTLLSFVDDMKKHPMFGGHPGV